MIDIGDALISFKPPLYAIIVYPLTISWFGDANSSNSKLSKICSFGPVSADGCNESVPYIQVNSVPSNTCGSSKDAVLVVA